jgi:PAS domain-containing protein
MAPVHAPRIVLLLVPAMTAVVIAHAYDGEGKWELLVSVLAVLAATLAILLARRDASTALARIATATGTVPYAGRLHPDGSWRGHVVGPGAAKMLGAPYSGPAWTAAVHPDDREAFGEACAAAARGEPQDLEYRIVRPGGEVREIWDRLLPSKGGAVEGVRVDITERRATERQLSAARRRLENVLHQLDEKVVTLEVHDDGSIVAVDAPAPRDAGDGALLPEDEVHPDDVTAYFEALGTIRRGGRVAVGIRRVVDEGGVRRLWVRSVPRTEPDGRRFADVIMSDVTDRAEMRAELQATRDQLDQVLASVAAVAYTLELDDELPALWQMTYVGPGWERVTGSERTTPGGMVQWLLAAVHPDDRVFVEQGYVQLARGSAIDRGFRLLLPEGTRHVHERARPRSDASGRMLADGILLDVTEARRTEERLSDAHDDLDWVVQSIDEVLYRAELGVDGWWHTVWKGPGHARLLGLPAALIEDDAFFDEVWNSAIHRDDRAAYVEAWGGLRPGTPIEVVYRLVSRDGTVRWLADRASARRTPDGSVVADCIAIDITEHRRVTDELAAARAESERIAADGEHRLVGLLTAADAGFAHIVVAADGPVLRFADPSLGERVLGRPLPSGVEVGAAVYGALEPAERERLVQAVATGGRFEVETRLRGLDGVVRSLAVEGLAEHGPDATDVFLVIRAVGQDPRIAALLAAVDEPVYEIELGADGLWRTTAGTGIERMVGVPGADERVLAAAVLDEDRATFAAHRVRLAAGQASTTEFRVRTAAGGVRWLWERAQGRREGDRVIVVAAIADVTAWHPAADDRVQT